MKSSYMNSHLIGNIDANIWVLFSVFLWIMSVVWFLRNQLMKTDRTSYLRNSSQIRAGKGAHKAWITGVYWGIILYSLSHSEFIYYSSYKCLLPITKDGLTSWWSTYLSTCKISRYVESPFYELSIISIIFCFYLREINI